MAPTLILIRHAQGEHNVAKDYNLHDPPLTALGQQQCLDLRKSLQDLPIAQEVDLIVVSPMRRTLQTMLGGLDWKIEQGVEVVVDADWQENSDKPCDTGISLSTLSAEFPNIDFSAVDPTYPKKTGNGNPYAFNKDAVLARGQRALKKVQEYRRSSGPRKGEAPHVIAIVSHSGFLRTAVSKAHYMNADYRVFDFAPSSIFSLFSDTEEILLREWDLTRERGGGLGRSFKGVAEIREGDFPPGSGVGTEVEGEESEKKLEDAPEKTDGEAAREVPRE